MDKVNEFFQTHGYTLIACAAVLIFLLYPNIGIYDWEKEVMYCDVIRQSLLEYRTFPMFLWHPGRFTVYPAVARSAFFAGNPETMLTSPLLPFLMALPPALFLKLVVLVNFIIGWAGLEALAKTCGWDTRRRRVFSALFFLSPIVFQHIAIGYLPWVNLFLLPWLFHYMLQEDFLRRSLGCGVILALILLQGGLHVFVWAGFTLAFFSLFQGIFEKRFRPLFALVLSGLVAGLLALPRVVTSYQSFSSFEQRFFSGYSPRAFFRWAFIPPFFTPRTMDDIEFFIEEYVDGVPYWDGNLFWGFLLICVLLLPLVFWHNRKKGKDSTTLDHNKAIYAFSVASLALLLFSFDSLYANLITFVADLAHLPALKGMEKYPFRFAIPAYFGFAFVVAHAWDQFLSFFNYILERLSDLFLAVYRQVTRFARYLRPHRKALTWITGAAVSACLLAFRLKSTLLEWMNGLIAEAYHGRGVDFLIRMMVNVDTIPLAVYQAKAAVLYGSISRFALAITILLVGAGLTVQLTKNGSKTNRKKKARSISIPVWLPEILLVLPLLLAFGMWWRVALATPMDNATGLDLQPPAIEWADQNSMDELPEMIFTPALLKLTVDKEMVGKTLIFPDIHTEDNQFLEVNGDVAQFSKVDDRLTLKLDQAGEIALRVKSRPLVISAAIAATAWILAVWMLSVRYRKIN